MEPLTPEAKGLKRACQIIEKDLQALPEEAFSKKFGDKARTVADIVFEVNLVNEDVLRSLKGETSPQWPDGWVKAPDNFQTKEAVIAGFLKSSEALVAAVAPLTSDQMLETVRTERGETNRGERCRFMTLHMWYHSGQINFVQTLMGDDGWHWD